MSGDRSVSLSWLADIIKSCKIQTLKTIPTVHHVNRVITSTQNKNWATFPKDSLPEQVEEKDISDKKWITRFTWKW